MARHCADICLFGRVVFERRSPTHTIALAIPSSTGGPGSVTPFPCIQAASRQLPVPLKKGSSHVLRGTHCRWSACRAGAPESDYGGARPGANGRLCLSSSRPRPSVSVLDVMLSEPVSRYRGSRVSQTARGTLFGIPACADEDTSGGAQSRPKPPASQNRLQPGDHVARPRGGCGEPRSSGGERVHCATMRIFAGRP